MHVYPIFISFSMPLFEDSIYMIFVDFGVGWCSIIQNELILLCGPSYDVTVRNMIAWFPWDLAGAPYSRYLISSSITHMETFNCPIQPDKSGKII